MKELITKLSQSNTFTEMNAVYNDLMIYTIDTNLYNTREIHNFMGSFEKKIELLKLIQNDRRD